MLIERLGPLEGAGRMVSFQSGEFNLILLSLPHNPQHFSGEVSPRIHRVNRVQGLDTQGGDAPFDCWRGLSLGEFRLSCLLLM